MTAMQQSLIDGLVRTLAESLEAALNAHQELARIDPDGTHHVPFRQFPASQAKRWITYVKSVGGRP